MSFGNLFNCFKCNKCLQVTVTSLSVSFDESIESLGLDDDAPVNIIKLANDVTHKRLKRLKTIVFDPTTDRIATKFVWRKTYFISYCKWPLVLHFYSIWKRTKKNLSLFQRVGTSDERERLFCFASRTLCNDRAECSSSRTPSQHSRSKQRDQIHQQ